MSAEYSNFYSNYISDEIFYKSFYRYLEDHKLSIYSIKNVLKNLKIIPVKGKVAGQTDPTLTEKSIVIFEFAEYITIQFFIR